MGASKQQTKKQRAVPQVPATLGGDELDDFQIPLEDVDQNAGEEAGETPIDQAADGTGGAADDRDADKPSRGTDEAAKREKKKKSKERLKVIFQCTKIPWAQRPSDRMPLPPSFAPPLIATSVAYSPHQCEHFEKNHTSLKDAVRDTNCTYCAAALHIFWQAIL